MFELDIAVEEALNQKNKLFHIKWPAPLSSQVLPYTTGICTVAVFIATGFDL